MSRVLSIAALSHAREYPAREKALPHPPVAKLAGELGVTLDGRAAVIGFVTTAAHPRMADVLALSASAFRHDSQVAANGSRVYVVLPDSGRTTSRMLSALLRITWMSH